MGDGVAGVCVHILLTCASAPNPKECPSLQPSSGNYNSRCLASFCHQVAAVEAIFSPTPSFLFCAMDLTSKEILRLSSGPRLPRS